MNELRAILPRPVLPPLWRDARVVGEAVEAIRHPAVPRGDWPRTARPVLLVPGFLAGDSSMGLLARFLRGSGYMPLASGIARNVDCSAASVDRLEAILETAAAVGGRVAVVRHSRGGLFARSLAVRRPDLVAGIVMLGSPHRDQLAVHPLLWAQIIATALLGSSGAAGLLHLGCATGSCCEDFRSQLTAPLPRNLDAVSVYSRQDGVVDWRSCLDDCATNVEVPVTHVGMIARQSVFAVVVDALAGCEFSCASRIRALPAAPEPGPALVPHTDVRAA